MAEIGISTLTLSNDREITIDLHRISMREYRAIFDDGQLQRDEDATVAKACGLDVDEYLDLPQPDVRLLIDAFLLAATQPLRVPNSASASTSA